MIRTIYLHVGCHKTGSTSIQNSLLASAQLLKENNYLYPVITRNSKPVPNLSAIFCSLVSDEPESYYGNIVAGYSDKKQILQLHEIYLAQLKQQIESFTGENLIISGEGISILKLEELQALKNILLELVGGDVRFKIIAFIRNPVTYSCSLCQQRVKNGTAIVNDLVLFERSKNRYYSNILLRVEQIFGKENIMVIRFEDAINYSDGLVCNFLEIIGLDNTIIKIVEPVHENKSLSHEAVILMSEINKKFPLVVDGKKNPARIQLMLNKIKKIPGEKFSFETDRCGIIWQNAIDDLKWIYENYNIEPYHYCENEFRSSKKLWSNESLLYIRNMLPQLNDGFREIIIQTVHNEIGVDIVNPVEQKKKDHFMNRLCSTIIGNWR